MEADTAQDVVGEDVENRIAQYVKLRDMMDQLEERQAAERKPLRAVIDQLGGWLQKFLDDNKLENLKTKSGSCYITTRFTASVQDPDGFMKFVKESGNFDLLERRANSTAVRDYVKEHNHLPTGVNLTQLSSIGVRRPGKKKED